MARVDVHRPDIELDAPTLVEGLPGLGLVGKIAVDHLVDTFDMPHYASCRCEGLPEVAVYDQDGAVQPPVRVHADPERDLLALQSDVPISPSGAREFATCVTGWFAEVDALPLFVTGTQRTEEGRTNVYGLSTGDAAGRLKDLGLAVPSERGVVSGPTGALLHQANSQDLDSLGFVVEASAQFPDPTAAKHLLDEAVAPLTGVDIDTEALVEHAEEIRSARERLAQQMDSADDDSSRAQPVGMFQ